MGKLYDAMSKSIFKYERDNWTAPKCIKAGKEAFNIICFENGLPPSMANNTYVIGVQVVRDSSMKDYEYKTV